MRGLSLWGPNRPRKITLLAAHPDDVEIAAGGLLLAMAAKGLPEEVDYLLLTGTTERQDEVRDAIGTFMPGARVQFHTHSLPDGRLPSVWGQVKEAVESISLPSDLVLAPSPEDAHQDHRILAEITTTVFRDHLILRYEIPKWDGDLARPSIYVPLTKDQALRKVEILNAKFPSQRHRDWWDEAVFLGLARLRGMECRAEYAEAFTTMKLTLSVD